MPGSPPAAVHTRTEPDSDERYCAWFGDRSGDILYFGESAFWSTFRANAGRATADLDHGGPARIGRFDLANEKFLPALVVTRPDDRSGVWDVLAHPNGRIYFTTYFGWAGSVDPATGRSRRFEAAGRGLNELSLGPDGSILATRYGVSGRREDGGSVVVLDADGQVVAEHSLEAPAGTIAAPKSVAYDPVREEIWVTTDLLPNRRDAEPTPRHDTYVLDSRGAELRRIESPEVQFIAFAPDGTGYRAEVTGRKLWLRIIPADPMRSRIEGLRIPLEHAFASGADFVQDIQIADDGRAVLTRWSGWVHVVDDTGSIESVRLPAVASEGLYYTAVLRDRRVCASYCGDLTVVCRDLHSSLW